MSVTLPVIELTAQEAFSHYYPLIRYCAKRRMTSRMIASGLDPDYVQRTVADTIDNALAHAWKMFVRYLDTKPTTKDAAIAAGVFASYQTTQVGSERSHSSYVDAFDKGKPEEMTDDFQAIHCSQEEQADDVQTDLLHDMARDLPADYREIAKGILKGQTVEQIASDSDSSRATIWRRHKAMTATLRRMLADHLDDSCPQPVDTRDDDRHVTTTDRPPVFPQSIPGEPAATPAVAQIGRKAMTLWSQTQGQSQPEQPREAKPRQPQPWKLVTINHRDWIGQAAAGGSAIWLLTEKD